MIKLLPKLLEWILKEVFKKIQAHSRLNPLPEISGSDTVNPEQFEKYKTLLQNFSDDLRQQRLVSFEKLDYIFPKEIKEIVVEMVRGSIKMGYFYTLKDSSVVYAESVIPSSSSIDQVTFSRIKEFDNG